MGIEKEFKRLDDTTTVWTPKDALTVDSFRKGSDYFHTNPTTNLIMDIRNIPVDHLTSKDVRDISESIENNISKRSKGRTAIIVNDEIAYGLSRMFKSLRESRSHEKPVEVIFQIFNDYDKALSWIADSNDAN